MMISPEGYYIMYLQNKTPAEILTCIHNLKNDIRHDKKLLEAQNGYDDNEILPSPDTRIWCNYMYLERAKRALKDMGVEYVPSKSEEAAEKFEKELKNLFRFTFKIGSEFSGHQIYTVTFNEDGSMGYDEEYIYPAEKPDEETEEAPFSKEDFCEMLKDLHLGEWKRSYKGDESADALRWKLKLELTDGKTFTFRGYNKYLWCFKRFTWLLGCDEYIKVDQHLPVAGVAELPTDYGEFAGIDNEARIKAGYPTIYEEPEK